MNTVCTQHCRVIEDCHVLCFCGRWKDVVQELKDEQVKTGQTLSLWQEYSRLSENCSLHLRHLWRQWEELSSSSLAPEQNTQAVIHTVEVSSGGF